MYINIVFFISFQPFLIQNPMPLPHQILDRFAVLLSTHPITASRHRFGSSTFNTITHSYSNKNFNITYNQCITINKVGKDVLTQTLYPYCTVHTSHLRSHSPLSPPISQDFRYVCWRKSELDFPDSVSRCSNQIEVLEYHVF